jgi:hypothetical protein
MDHTISRMPNTPYLHVAVTVRTAQRVPTRALLIPLTVGERGDNLDRALDDALDLRQGLLNEALQPGKRLGRLHSVVAYSLEAFRKHMLYHAPDKGVDLHRFPLDPLALM